MKLGIDFGSTYTYIYTYTNSGELKDVCELNLANTCCVVGAGIPTMIEREGGQIKIGKQVEKAEDKKEVEKAEDKKGLLLKDRFRRHYLPNCKNDINYEDLIKDTIAFFNEIIRLAGINKRTVSEVVFGLPVTAAWEEANKKAGKNGVEKISYASDMIKDVFSKVFPGVFVQYLEEPILAGMSELSSDDTITEKDIVLVADFGGGTNDFALIQKKKNGKWHVIKTFGGGGGFAGRDLDVAIQKEIKAKTGCIVSLQRVREVKENLFKEELRDDEESRSIPLQDSDDVVLLSYGDDSGAIDVYDVVEEWITGAIAPKNDYQEYIATHKNNVATHLIFAGGTSNIGPLRSAFFDCVNAAHEEEGLLPIPCERVRVVSKPAAAVARGAAMYSLKSVSESEDERPQDYYLCLTNGGKENSQKLSFVRVKGKYGYYRYSTLCYINDEKGLLYCTMDQFKKAKSEERFSRLKGDCDFYFKKGENRFPLDNENKFFKIDFPKGSGTIIVVYPDPMKKVERTLYFWVVPQDAQKSADSFFGYTNALLSEVEMYSLRGRIEEEKIWSLTRLIFKEREEV